MHQQFDGHARAVLADVLLLERGELSGRFELLDRALRERIDVGEPIRAAEHFECERALRVRERGQTAILKYRLFGVNIRSLKGFGDSEVHAARPAEPRDVTALEEDRAARDIGRAREHVEERRLPGAVRPDHRPQFTLGNAEIDIGVGRKPPERLAEPLRLKDCGHFEDPVLTDFASSARSFARPEKRLAIVPTMPAGKKMITATKITPSTRRQ